MKKQILLLLSCGVLLLSAPAYAFCVYNSLDTEIGVACNDFSSMLLYPGDYGCENIEVESMRWVCIPYKEEFGDGEVTVTAVSVQHNFQCTRQIARTGGIIWLGWDRDDRFPKSVICSTEKNNEGSKGVPAIRP